MDKPLVSIVTITRNRGNMIKRCIASVLAQTYTNIEHIVVDGASDDNTDNVVNGFEDQRLKFVKLDCNWPIIETLNHGISLCNGKYLTFLDSDDEYLPTKVEKQVDLLESLSEEYGLVYCWMTYYDTSNNNQVCRIHRTELRGDVSNEVVKAPLVSGTPTLMFRTDFFRKFEGWKKPEEIGIGSDWEMCARACQLCKVDYVPESLVKVYINHGSVRQTDSKNYYNAYYERLIRFHKHFLTQFADIFERHPSYALYHYTILTQTYSKLKQRKAAMYYLWKNALIGAPMIQMLKQMVKIIIGR